MSCWIPAGASDTPTRGAQAHGRCATGCPWRDSWAIEAALVMLLSLTAVLMVAGLRADLPLNVSTWRTKAGGDPTWLDGGTRWCASRCSSSCSGRWRWPLPTRTRFLPALLAAGFCSSFPPIPDAAGGLAGLGVAHAPLRRSAWRLAPSSPRAMPNRSFLRGPAHQVCHRQRPPSLATIFTLIAPLAFFTPVNNTLSINIAWRSHRCIG